MGKHDVAPYVPSLAAQFGEGEKLLWCQTMLPSVACLLVVCIHYFCTCTDIADTDVFALIVFDRTLK